MSSYQADLVNTRSGFMGAYELDFVVVSVGSTDISYTVALRDANYQNCLFTRSFPSFNSAFYFFR